MIKKIAAQKDYDIAVCASYGIDLDADKEGVEGVEGDGYGVGVCFYVGIGVGLTF